MLLFLIGLGISRFEDMEINILEIKSAKKVLCKLGKQQKLSADEYLKIVIIIIQVFRKEI